MQIIILNYLIFRMLVFGNKNVKQLMNKSKLFSYKITIYKILIENKQTLQKEIKNRFILIIIIIIDFLFSVYALF
jgi:hypothetical protein